MLMVESGAGVARMIATFCVLYGVGTDEALAEAVTKAGEPLGYSVSQQTVNNYKNGKKNPPVKFVVAFVRALGLSPEHSREFLRAYMRENPEQEDFLRLWASV